jgi:hypothetical protein
MQLLLMLQLWNSTLVLRFTLLKCLPLMSLIITSSSSSSAAADSDAAAAAGGTEEESRYSKNIAEKQRYFSDFVVRTISN